MSLIDGSILRDSKTEQTFWVIGTLEMVLRIFQKYSLILLKFIFFSVF